MRTERKPPLNVRAVQRLYHLRQGDYLAKDDVSISKQVEAVSIAAHDIGTPSYEFTVLSCFHFLS